MSSIKSISALEILDSRGVPTVECRVELYSGIIATASVPSGASVGLHEAVERRDLDAKRYFGKGVIEVVKSINTEIASALIGLNVLDQKKIDNCLIQCDGSKNKQRLGANALLAVSLAVSKAAAKFRGLPLYKHLGGEGPFVLPVPLINVINGGAHANNSLDIQEFMLVPLGLDSFSSAVQCVAEVFHELRRLLAVKGYSTAVGDEGGFAPDLTDNKQAIEFILQAITAAGYRPGEQVGLALDIASSEIYADGKYSLKSENKIFTPAHWVDYLAKLVSDYPIISIEDGMAEEDWDGWSQLTRALGGKIQLVGDDIFVTNTELLRKGINAGVANAILIKPNQIGTLTETLMAIDLAKSHDYNVILSHRSGETEDTSIVDIATAVSCGQIKSGSMCRGERIAKYNQLLRIEQELGDNSCYGGSLLFKQYGEVCTNLVD